MMVCMDYTFSAVCMLFNLVIIVVEYRAYASLCKSRDTKVWAVSIAMCFKIKQYWTTRYPFSSVRMLNSCPNLFVIFLFDVVWETQVSYIDRKLGKGLAIHPHFTHCDRCSWQKPGWSIWKYRTPLALKYSGLSYGLLMTAMRGVIEQSAGILPS